MKAVWWALCAAALVLCLMVGIPKEYSVVFAPRAGPPQPATTAVTDCPPRSLADHGACIPVPRPSAPFEGIPRVPTRPEALSAYVLPAGGEAMLATFADLAVPAGLPTSGFALVIAAPDGARVRAVAVAAAPAELHATGDDWVLVRHMHATTQERFVVLYAPLGVELRADPGAPLEPGHVLGRTRPGGLGLAIRKLRPGKGFTEPQVVLSDAHSMLTDPRNVLELVPKTE